MRNSEFESIMSDPSKQVVGDIAWNEDEDRSPAVEFSVALEYNPGYPLRVYGRYNCEAHTLSYSILHRTYGRVYGLDLGKDHHNSDCRHTGDRHKHRWDEQLGIKSAYEPDDVTATVDDPVSVWDQFCAEARIVHQGRMHSPPPPKLDML